MHLLMMSDALIRRGKCYQGSNGQPYNRIKTGKLDVHVDLGARNFFSYEVNYLQVNNYIFMYGVSR